MRSILDERASAFAMSPRLKASLAARRIMHGSSCLSASSHMESESSPSAQSAIHYPYLLMILAASLSLPELIRWNSLSVTGMP